MSRLDCQQAVLIDVGRVKQLSPIVARLSMILQHFFFLSGIVQLDASGTLVDPIDEKLGRLFAHARFIADFDVVGSRAGEAEGLGVFRDGFDKKPTAAVEFYWR